MALLMPWAPFWRGRKIAKQTLKFMIYGFLNLYFAPHTMGVANGRGQRGHGPSHSVLWEAFFQTKWCYSPKSWLRHCPIQPLTTKLQHHRGGVLRQHDEILWQNCGIVTQDGLTLWQTKTLACRMYIKDIVISVANVPIFLQVQARFFSQSCVFFEDLRFACFIWKLPLFGLVFYSCRLPFCK